MPSLQEMLGRALPSWKRGGLAGTCAKQSAEKPYVSVRSMIYA